MRNFNTNQTRHLYVADAVDNSHAITSDDFAAKSIALAQTATGEAYFKYKNAEGMVTRSDTFDPKKICSLKLTSAADMATQLQAIVFAPKSSVNDATGKDITVAVTVHDAFDYDSQYVVSATVTVPASATTSVLCNEIGKALYKAIPQTDGYPAFAVYVATAAAATKVTDANKDTETVRASATRVILAVLPQKFVLGKLSGEPCRITAAFRGEVEDWATVDTTKTTVTAVNIGAVAPATISGTYAIADLEYFAAGERGDYWRGATWPNNYEFVPAVVLTNTYNVLSIEYYWNGDAENVQKSPRLIQVAGKVTGSGSQATCPADDLYASIQSMMNGTGSGSGSGA